MNTSVLTAVLFGLAPALRAARPDLVPALKNETGGHRRRPLLRDGLAVAQISLTVTLVFGAGLFLRSFRATQSIDPGFDPDGDFAVRVLS